jgi:hypothetical protein
MFDIILSILNMVAVRSSPSVATAASASVDLTVLSTEAGGRVHSIAYSMFIIRRFFWPPSLPSVAEGISLFCKRFVSSNLRGLSSLNGGDSDITFKISDTLAIEGEGGLIIFSGASCTFGSAEGILSSFRF